MLKTPTACAGHLVERVRLAGDVESFGDCGRPVRAPHSTAASRRSSHTARWCSADVTRALDAAIVQHPERGRPELIGRRHRISAARRRSESTGHARPTGRRAPAPLATARAAPRRASQPRVTARSISRGARTRLLDHQRRRGTAARAAHVSARSGRRSPGDDRGRRSQITSDGRAMSDGPIGYSEAVARARADPRSSSSGPTSTSTCSPSRCAAGRPS